MTLEQELAAAYENLTSTQKRCTELLEEKRALLARAAALEAELAALTERNQLLEAMVAAARPLVVYARVEHNCREFWEDGKGIDCDYFVNWDQALRALDAADREART